MNATQNGQSPTLVLIVEDESGIATMLADVIVRLNCRFLVTETVAQAKAAIRSTSKFDLLVCDLCLPDGNSFEVIEAAIKLGISTIIVTGYAAKFSDELAAKVDNDKVHLLTKPFLIDTFVKAVQRALRRT